MGISAPLDSKYRLIIILNAIRWLSNHLKSAGNNAILCYRSSQRKTQNIILSSEATILEEEEEEEEEQQEEEKEIEEDQQYDFLEEFEVKVDDGE